MQDVFDTFTGQFCIQCLKNGVITDVYEDHNYIMTSARRSVAELFVGASSRRLSKLVLGTAGGLGDVYTPITEATGFSRDRTQLFSAGVINARLNETKTLSAGDLVRISNTSITYQYKGAKQSVQLTQTNLSTLFNVYDAPLYTYEVAVNPYSQVVLTGTENFATDTSNSAFVSYDNDKTITYTFEIPTSAANEQYTRDGDQQSIYSMINEAGLYVNNRLFAMKCFPAKLKDDSTSLKIIWKILF